MSRRLVLLFLMALPACDRPATDPATSPAADEPRPAPATVAPTSTSAFLGTFRGDRLVLALVGDGRGTLSIKGNPFPVTVSAQANRLQGQLTTKGQQHPFQAALVGNVLDLTVDGRTYQLRKEGNTPQSEWSGSFAGLLQGTAAKLSLRRRATALGGTLRHQGYRYPLTGKVRGQRASGSLRDPHTGTQMAFNATLNGDRVLLNLRIPDTKGRIAYHALVLERR